MKERKPQLPRRTYHPNCAVCQYEKAHKDFRYDMLKSTYFNPDGVETVTDVINRYGNPFKAPSFYAHLQRHRKKDVELGKKNYEIKQQDKALLPTTPATLITAVESEVLATAPHEQGLDEFIRQGRTKLSMDEMPITPTNFLQAIKIKADIEKSTKDRRLDAVKSMFKGITGDSRTGPTRED